MSDLLVKLMVIAAFAQFGMNLAQVERCHSKGCMQMLEKHSRDFLSIDWKPISVFPNEARRFR